jgi:Mn2+/Fe2+ NRAMP family transporter
MMVAVQYTCAKIGMVSGHGLTAVLRRHYSRGLLYPVVLVLLVANTINAGVDIGAIAAGLNLLVPVPVSWFIFPVTLVILALQLWGSYRLIVYVCKWLTLALLAYIGATLFARPDPAAVLHGTFVPTLRFDNDFLAALVPILGTTISPYLFFWQATHEVEEAKSVGRRRLWVRRGVSDQELTSAALDVNAGMLASNLVMYFIILATAATLHQAGRTDIQTAADAAEALRPLAGDAASLLLTLGLVGSGFLAVPVLTGSSAYAVCEAFGWRQGLDHRPGKAKAFFAIIVVSTLAGALLNFIGVNPMTALFWTAVLNGLLAPPLLVVVLRIANNKEIMGRRINTPWVNTLGWLTTVAMFAAAVGLVWTWIKS